MEQRIIKFRAWDERHKEMWYPVKAGISGLKSHDILERYEIVMQFTGLTDKNGKEIYEGDIVDCYFSEPSVGIVRYEVFFDEEEAMFKLRNNLGYCMLTYRTIEILIVGSMYSNPELIK